MELLTRTAGLPSISASQPGHSGKNDGKMGGRRWRRPKALPVTELWARTVRITPTHTEHRTPKSRDHQSGCLFQSSAPHLCLQSETHCDFSSRAQSAAVVKTDYHKPNTLQKKMSFLEVARWQATLFMTPFGGRPFTGVAYNNRNTQMFAL